MMQTEPLTANFNANFNANPFQQDSTKVNPYQKLQTTPKATQDPATQKEKTKKKKQKLNTNDKAKLWNQFDTVICNPKPKLECVYEKLNNAGDVCSQCQSVLVIMEDGYPTCSNNKCGLIYTEALDYSPEWRFFGADDKNTNDPTRCGNPINPNLPESSFGCKVLCGPKSSYEMKKIRRWIEWQSMPHKEKSLYDEFQFISTMAQNAGIPKIFIDEAMIIHKDISEQKIFRGVNRDGVKAASIYISCRLNGFPRTSHEIAEIFHINKTSATHGCSVALNILNNIERKNETDPQDMCNTTSTLFIERYCSKLNMNQELSMLAKFISTKIENENIITDNNPQSITAGIIYFISQCCSLNISKQDIRQVCGVSEVTTNKCFKKLELYKDYLIPKCLLDKYTQKGV